MAYRVDTYSGSKTFVIEDGTINSSLSVRLVGKNYAGYGEVQNENFVHLLENFAGSAPPPRPINGQIWFDASVRKIKFYDSTVSKWRIPGGAEVNAEPPSGQNIGDLWWDEENRQLYGFDGNNHILIGPQAIVGAGTTELRSVTVTTTTDEAKSVILGYVDGEVTFVISKDTFDLSSNSQGDIGGTYSKIRAGLTLNDTALNGVTTGTTLTNGYIYWGTASSSLGLVDNLGELLTADDFLKADTNLTNFTTTVSFNDSGYTLGNSNDLEVKIDVDGTTPVFTNKVSNKIKFKTLNGSYTPFTLEGNNILPGNDNATDIGSASLRFKNIYAAELQGTATSAYYADLAEKYLTDTEYDVGTVVVIGGKKEVTACMNGDKAFGAVSANPAFKMNDGLIGGTYIALKGRVPIKVLGVVNKGSKLIASNNGCARELGPNDEKSNVFAIALESSNDQDIKLIEAVIL